MDPMLSPSWTRFRCTRCGKEFRIRRKKLKIRKTDFCKSCLLTVRNRSPEGRERSRQNGLRKPDEQSKQKLSRSRRAYYERNGVDHITGENNPFWKGGVSINTAGYRMVRCPGHPRATKRGSYVQEHILVMERHIGRYLEESEVVHHKNGNRQDNRIENLQLMTSSEHTRFHSQKRWHKCE
jgi:DNA-directed RNA polymerase subunit RPC12/RpoP